MAHRRFQIIKEKPVATLSKRLQASWQALVRKRERLTDLEAQLDTATRTFFTAVEKTVPMSDGEKVAYRGLRMDNDGTLYQVFCDCASCQAGLHDMSVTAVVEEMIRQDLIDEDEVESVRERASEIDSAKRSNAKKVLLLN